MGRPERPIDPDAGSVAEFAQELRQLREKAGRPSYRELARRASFSVTVLSEAAGGRSFPTLAVVRGYVRACSGDTAEWDERWRRASAQRRAQATRSVPYLGLASYQAEHADLFFGRDALTADLLRRVAAGRFLAVFGPSGSGKSSLLRAGLLAAVRRGDPPGDRGSVTGWVPRLMTPGEQPVTALAEVLAERPADAELLLVVDQFEELFTMCGDAGQRDAFVRALLAAAGGDDTWVRVVLGVRADYYAQCATWPELVTALRDAQLLVGPMAPDELREVIVKPAERTGTAVEQALVATAVAEASAEPGALALVSHAMLETWRHSPPGRLTLTAYQQSGGVPHAIASTAEHVYAGCDDAERRMLRRVFLRLVALGDGVPDARRRVAPDELAAGSDPGAAAGLVEKLAEARLVTADDGAVQLAHEALIRFWPRLADWLTESREDLRVQRRLADAATEWARLDRDPAALFRGTPLAAAQGWAERDGGLTGLTGGEREFLEASGAAQEAGHAAALRTARRLRRLAAALVVLLAAASVTAGVAAWQRQTAVDAEEAAVSGQFATTADDLAPVNAGAGVLAALAAWHARPTTAARSALLSTAACCRSTQTALPGSDGVVNAVALAPGGTLLAAGGLDRVVRLWDPATGRELATLRGFAGQVTAVAVSPDGTLVAAGSADRTIRLWSTRRDSFVGMFSCGGAVGELAFSPGGGLLAAACANGEVRLWHPGGGLAGQIPPPPGGQGAAPPGGSTSPPVAFSPDGGVLAVGAGRAVTLWNIADPARPRPAGDLAGAGTSLVGLAYSPARDLLAGEERGGGVLLWHLSSGSVARVRRMLLPHAAAGSRGLAFTGDGTVLITGGNYSSVLLWNTATGQQVAAEARHIRGLDRALAYDPGSGILALGGADGSVQLWQAPVAPFTGHTAPVNGLAVSPGGATLASAGGDGAVRLWHPDGTPAATRSLGAGLTAVTVSPDGRLLAAAAANGTVTLLGLPGLVPVGPVHVTGPVADVAFSPDGTELAVAAGATVSTWATTGGPRRLLLRPGSGGVDAIAYAPGGRTLAAVTHRGNVIVWDARTGQPVARVRPGNAPANGLAFSSGGQYLATADNNGDITLRNPATLGRVATLAGSVGSVLALAFSPDGQLLAAGEDNGTIQLWDVASRSQAATLTGDRDTVRALAFAPDGTTLYSGGSPNRIVAWNLDPAATARADCQVLARDPGLGQAEKLVPGASYHQLCPASS